MSAEKTLLATYQEWQRLAEAEGKAIRRRNWNFLLECQDFIKNLQPLITQLTRETVAEWQQAGADLVAKKNELRALVAKLMTLAQQNQSELITARAIAKAEREQLEQARQNLKRLQQSYVVARPAAWSSLS